MAVGLQFGQEEQDKDRPLILDFGTENCFWCKKIRGNDLPGSGHRRVAQRPTSLSKWMPIVKECLPRHCTSRAIPRWCWPHRMGRSLGTLEGYLEAYRLQEHLQRVLASVSNPEWMSRDYQEAAKAIAASDYAKAIALLKNITEDGKERPAQVKARQLLGDLEQQAAGRLAKAKQLDDKGQNTEATNVLSELLRLYAGTQAAQEASQMLTALAASRN